MGTHYSHLSYADRVYIEVLLRAGASVAGVARCVGCHRSTVHREVSRACRGGFARYAADFGEQSRRFKRRRAGLARRKLGTDLNSPAWQFVRDGLASGRSPEQIAGRLASQCQGQHLRHPLYVSHETIYCAIYAMPRGTLRAELVRSLPRSHSGRLPRSRGQARSTRLPDMTPIALRPPEVAARTVPGHWEGDLIKGKANRSAVGTLVERISRYVMLVKLDGLTSGHILQGFGNRLRAVPPSLRKTLTYDQGSEMACHKTLAKRLRMDVFFCDAHSPWQRGSNEHANGLIRRYLPKGMDLSPFTDEDLRRVEFILNNTPRKILGFKTPAEVFKQLKLDNIAGVALQP